MTAYGEYFVRNSASDVDNMQSQTLERFAAGETFYRQNTNIDRAVGEIGQVADGVPAVMVQAVRHPNMIQYGTSDVGSPVMVIGQGLTSLPVANDDD